MTDEELVADAFDFAKQLAAKVSGERRHILEDDRDGTAWAVTCLGELTRIIAISFVAACGKDELFALFMRHVADQCTVSAEDPDIVAEATAKAGRVAARIDAGNSTAQ